MSNNEKFINLLSLCEDLQVQVHTRDVTKDINSLRFSCDLLLRNMIMILDLKQNDQGIEKEYDYITSNILGSFAHLTGRDAETAVRKYNIPY